MTDSTFLFWFGIFYFFGLIIRSEIHYLEKIQIQPQLTPQPTPQPLVAAVQTQRPPEKPILQPYTGARAVEVEDGVFEFTH